MFDHKSGAYLQTEDANLYYETQGNPENPPLLFLHGGLRHMETLNPLADALASDFYLIGMDSRGQGRSELGALALSYQKMEEDVLALMQLLNLDKVSIIGHSDGGIIGYRLAANHPEKVDRLITIGSRAAVEQGKSNWEEFMHLEPSVMEENMPQRVKDYQSMNPSPNLKNLCTLFRALWMDASPSGHPKEAVKNIQARALLIRGKEDPYLSLESLQQNHQWIANSTLVEVPDAKHDVALENSAMAQQVIRKFLLAS